MVPEVLPPHRHISSRPISTSDASTLLSTYLSNSEIYAHLHPDALITPTGVTFSTHGGPMGGVTMHNLRRVAAGLRGEYLEREKTPEPEDQSNEQSRQDKPYYEGKGWVPASGQGVDAVEDGWQNMSEYEREQGPEIGELGKRDTFVASGENVHPEVEVAGEAEEDEGELGRKRKAKNDKEARKKAKKARNKEFKKDKEMKRTTKDE